jgi:hypothetical protein
MDAKNCVAIFNVIEHTPSFATQMPPLYKRGILKTISENHENHFNQWF